MNFNGEERAKHYDDLLWVPMIDEFVDMCEPQKTDLVCDVGAGTGAVSHALLGKVKSIIAIDTSQEMLDKIEKCCEITTSWEHAERYLSRHHQTFDLITCRMVMHHIQEDIALSSVECHNALKHGGRIVIAEGIYPRGCRSFYKSIFQDKEPGRHCYSVSDLVSLVDTYRNVEVKVIKQYNMSLKNWLVNSGTTGDVYEKVWHKHAHAPGYVKKAYNMRETENDIIMDWEQCIVKGTK